MKDTLDKESVDRLVEELEKKITESEYWRDRYFKEEDLTSYIRSLGELDALRVVHRILMMELRK